MPSHIFTRVGAWEESVATNRALAEGGGASRRRARRGLPRERLRGVRVPAARARRRRAAHDRRSDDGWPAPARRFVAPYASGRDARALCDRARRLEGGGEAQAAGEQAIPSSTRITYFARALGAARSGDVAAARKDAEQLDDFHKALLDAKNTYWATEVEVQRLAVAGWIALGEGKTDEALKFMRAAADLEDRNEKHIVTPGRIVPARELLGEMLLELKQPAAALKEFEASQEREPNRFRNYAGSARAAEMAGDTVKAGRVLPEAARSSRRTPTRCAPSLRWREVRRAMRSLSGIITAGILALAAAPVVADPYEADPDLATTDEDYAAGKKAIDRKDWAEAVRLFELSEKRNPDQRGPAEHPRLLVPQPEAATSSRSSTTSARSRSIPATAARTSTSARPIFSWATWPVRRSTSRR